MRDSSGESDSWYEESFIDDPDGSIVWLTLIETPEVPEETETAEEEPEYMPNDGDVPSEEREESGTEESPPE